MGEVADSSPDGQSPGGSGNEGAARRQPSGSRSKSSTRITGGSTSGALENDLTNQQIGRYLIQRRLGSGGTAVVYQAFDQVRGRSVALKVLASTADEKMLLRFRREAMTSGVLHHPNIVRTLQVGVAPHGDVAYIAMELVEGESLSALLERCGYLDPDEAAALLAPIATAMAHAHENEIVHRDVKPSNILLHPAGSGRENSVHIGVLDFPAIPMLSDFGIARSLDSPELTNLGRTVGTPAYMAPEQCAGQRYIDGRADIYSLGAVFYRCVVGRQPFLGATPQILHAHVYEPLTIDDEILRRLPPLAVEILSRSMSKQPDERYATAREMAAALAEAGGYEIEVEPSQSAPTPTTTMTLDNLEVSTDSSTVAASVLVPGIATTKALKSSDSVAKPDAGAQTPKTSSQYDLDGASSYYATDRGLNTWRWSSLALLFVGILVGAFTALFMSGAFDRLFELSPSDTTGGTTGDTTLIATATSTIVNDTAPLASTPGDTVEPLPTESTPTPPIDDAPAAAVTIDTAQDIDTPTSPASSPSTANSPTANSPASNNGVGTAVPTDSSTDGSASDTPILTLVPTSTPLVTPTSTATTSPTGTSTTAASSTPTSTATGTWTSVPTNTPLAPPTATWTVPAAVATSGTATLPSTPTPPASGTEPAESTPTATLLPPTATWTPGSQAGD